MTFEEILKFLREGETVRVSLAGVIEQYTYRVVGNFIEGISCQTGEVFTDDDINGEYILNGEWEVVQ